MFLTTFLIRVKIAVIPYRYFLLTEKIEPQDRALRLAEYDGFCLKSAAEKRQQQTDDLMIDIAAMHSETDARKFPELNQFP